MAGKKMNVYQEAEAYGITEKSLEFVREHFQLPRSSWRGTGVAS